jgi:hypothetical protein
MNWKGYGRKWLLRYYPGICFEILRTVSIQADIHTRNLPNTSQEHNNFQFYFGNHRKCMMKSKAGYQTRSKG